jgi:hypothetical protein
MFRPSPVPSIAAIALWVSLTGSAAAQHAGKPTQIDVVAKDYTFMPLPAHIAAGPTLFSFANQGTVQHELSIGRLKAGVSVDDVVKAIKEGARPRDLIERSVGVLIAGGGKSPEGRLLVDLIHGSSYIVLCTLRNTPNDPPHAMLGMYTGFKPE